MSHTKQIALRFFTTFLKGGITSSVILFSPALQFANFSDLKKFGLALVISFLTGGIAAFEKSLVPTPTTTQTIVQNVPVSPSQPLGATIFTATTNVPENTSVTSIPTVSDPSSTGTPSQE